MDLVSRVLSRRLVPVGVLLGAMSSIFTSITGVPRRERAGERSPTESGRVIPKSSNSARISVSTPGVVARLRLLIIISRSSESMNIGVDDEVADIWLLPEAVAWLCWLC